MENYIPGTNIKLLDINDVFSTFKVMIDTCGGLSLSQVCSITGLQTSTIQNWVKRKFVPSPIKKKYYERHLARILLISALRDSMNIEDIGELMILINGDTEDESDDIVSESKLYDYFCKSISYLTTITLDDERIEEVIRQAIDAEEVKNQEKLIYALKVMVYAYINGKCLLQINMNLEKLKEE